MVADFTVSAEMAQFHETCKNAKFFSRRWVMLCRRRRCCHPCVTLSPRTSRETDVNTKRRGLPALFFLISGFKTQFQVSSENIFFFFNFLFFVQPPLSATCFFNWEAKPFFSYLLSSSSSSSICLYFSTESVYGSLPFTFPRGERASSMAKMMVDSLDRKRARLNDAP